MPTTIVFHDNCHDGITALWCALQKFPHAEHYPAKYSEAPDLDRLRDRDVVMVDFSWKRGPMADVLDVCRTLRVLDHHKTAEEELRHFVGNISDKYTCVIDTGRSGAGIAWDELVGGPRPRLVDYVEDRDLWKFALPWSREVHAACASYPLDINFRHMLMQRSIQELAEEGEAILRYHDKLVRSAIDSAHREVIGGHDVPAIACPFRELASDLGNELARGQPFAAVYTDQPDGARVYQLRSSPEGLDVSEVAKSLGGGGHRNAAGFTRAPGSVNGTFVNVTFGGGLIGPEREVGRAIMRELQSAGVLASAAESTFRGKPAPANIVPAGQGRLLCVLCDQEIEVTHLTTQARTDGTCEVDAWIDRHRHSPVGHPFIGEGPDCEACGEGRAFYMHREATTGALRKPG